MNNGLECGCGTFMLANPDIANEIILKWCEMHPSETYKDYFMLSFPNCKTTPHGVPVWCRNEVFRKKDCIGDCVKCWNTVREEVEFDCNIRYPKESKDCEID